MTYTLEQKYNFLLSLFDVHDIDYWEKDALFSTAEIYFQFSEEAMLKDKDYIVQGIMAERGL